MDPKELREALDCLAKFMGSRNYEIFAADAPLGVRDVVRIYVTGPQAWDALAHVPGSAVRRREDGPGMVSRIVSAMIAPRLEIVCTEVMGSAND